MAAIFRAVPAVVQAVRTHIRAVNDFKTLIVQRQGEFEDAMARSAPRWASDCFNFEILSKAGVE
jgi:hypothetical protein